jgi:hypothetical protein
MHKIKDCAKKHAKEKTELEQAAQCIKTNESYAKRGKLPSRFFSF